MLSDKSGETFASAERSRLTGTFLQPYLGAVWTKPALRTMAKVTTK
ncbi:hypothetical protein IJ21_36350 [Paenibacillus sp. 32O-W]|nr:hypothetical protein [Paenibacillus sp. 32O-W]ALS29023.1 hypothetical protein IJ21_36350 [Paenibacillus sp. 32O-W]